jgi:hypothetical protein
MIFYTDNKLKDKIAFPLHFPPFTGMITVKVSSARKLAVNSIRLKPGSSRMGPTVSSKPAEAGELSNGTFRPFAKNANGDRFSSCRLLRTQTGIGPQ